MPALHFSQYAAQLDPEEIARAKLSYEHARKKASMPRMGLPHCRVARNAPFQHYAWARTEYQSLPLDGVAFSVWSACFAGRDPLLFFVESDVREPCPLEEVKTWEPGWAGEVWRNIEGYSSGIRVEGLCGRAVLFRLDPSRIRSQDIFYGGTLVLEDSSFHRDMLGPEDFIFTWPGAGEFDCTLGEVIDGMLVPLMRDDYCMK